MARIIKPKVCGACGVKDGRATVQRKKVIICLECAGHALANHLIIASDEFGGKNCVVEMSSDVARRAMADYKAEKRN